MRNVIKKVIAILISIVVLFISINYLGILLRPIDTDGPTQAIENFHNMPKNSIEVIGYGSSHMWKTLNPIIMYEKYGIGAYNYGCNWQRLNTTLLFLEESLLFQSPKIVIVETYGINKIHKDVDVNGEIYYTRAIKNFDGKRRYLKQVFGNDWEKYFSYYFPLYIFHDNWVNLKKANFASIDYSWKYKKYMGGTFTDAIKEITIGKYTANTQKEINEDSIKILDRIMQLSKEHNFKVIFITVPYGTNETFDYSDAMTKYANDNGAIYIDLFKKIDELKLDGKTDFQDLGHVNITGANKISNYLGKFIKDNYDVTDMRQVENNLWQQIINGNY